MPRDKPCRPSALEQRPPVTACESVPCRVQARAQRPQVPAIQCLYWQEKRNGILYRLFERRKEKASVVGLNDSTPDGKPAKRLPSMAAAPPRPETP
ncbi:hypothetical protein JEQ12_015227 [Ovis aries]|uniref:Uncharacterized protein n=1 Tax=Ovis aries TaxID=9940 RepID=A0A836D4X9_SHEEP|nr:hypothetical protein JEQ12_015227 [Ovis aries]